MSLIGARLSLYIHNQQCSDITSLEDPVSIEPNPLQWYRWTQLHLSGISKLYFANIGINFTTTNSHIIYIPTMLFKNDLDFTLLSSQFNFLNKLLLLATNRAKVTVVIPSVSDDVIMMGWLFAFEQLVNAYQSNLDIALVKVGHTYGPWMEHYDNIVQLNCWYVDDIVKKIYHISNRQEYCKEWNIETCPITQYEKPCEITTQNKGLAQTISWSLKYDSYISNDQVRNVIAGHYLIFVQQYRWGHKAPPNQVNYFSEWYLSAKQFGNDIVIFHDHLSSDLQQNVTKDYPKTEFVKVKPINRRILHDQRFYMTYKYLLSHPEIKYLVMTDIRDCIFHNDPIKTMSIVGDYFFIDNDVPFYRTVKDIRWLYQMTYICYDLTKFLREVVQLTGCFDNGFMGGTRHVMLSVLSRMILLLDTAYNKAVCDQVTANIVYHGYFYKHVYAGYPLTSSFMTGISGPVGVSVKHKPKVLNTNRYRY